MHYTNDDRNISKPITGNFKTISNILRELTHWLPISVNTCIVHWVDYHGHVHYNFCPWQIHSVQYNFLETLPINLKHFLSGFGVCLKPMTACNCVYASGGTRGGYLQKVIKYCQGVPIPCWNIWEIVLKYYTYATWHKCRELCLDSVMITLD